MPTRRIFELTLITIVLWDLGKITARIWAHKTWASTTPGSVGHEAADIVSAFV
jgi:hypothetical protein